MVVRMCWCVVRGMCVVRGVYSNGCAWLCKGVPGYKTRPQLNSRLTNNITGLYQSRPSNHTSDIIHDYRVKGVNKYAFISTHHITRSHLITSHRLFLHITSIPLHIHLPHIYSSHPPPSYPPPLHTHTLSSHIFTPSIPNHSFILHLLYFLEPEELLSLELVQLSFNVCECCVQSRQQFLFQ